MSSTQLLPLTTRLAMSCCAVTLVLVNAPAVWAQSPQGLFRQVDLLSFNEDRRPGRNVALSGDTAVVYREAPLPAVSEVYVFEREPSGNDWGQTATLAPADGTPGFGQRATTDGQTIVVTAQAANFVFERVEGSQWQEVAKLTGGSASIGGPTTIFVRSAGVVFVFERTADRGWQEVATLTGDPAAATFGTAGFAVSGSTALVGAPGTPGVVYVFEQHNGGPHAWAEAARLTSPSPPSGTADVFGASVAIDGDNAVVSALLDNGDAGAYVFSRNRRRADTWRQVAALSLQAGQAGPEAVSISDDTVAVVSVPVSAPPFFQPVIRMFQRNQGGVNAWGEVAVLPWGRLITISGNLMLVGGGYPPENHADTVVYSRNQGAKDAWGAVLTFPTSFFGEAIVVQARALGGDTTFVGSRFCATCVPGSSLPSPIVVYAADTDRDGVRDGIDPCPRDPLNNVAGSCQRASTVHPVLDELIAQGDVTSETRNRRQIITATFTNTSDTAVQNPFFEVTELTGHNVVLNSDAGRGRIGATLSPDVGDGVLSPGESMTVTFRIRLRTPDPYQFFVAFHGDPIPE